MTTREFIEKAIRGGWTPNGMNFKSFEWDYNTAMANCYHQPTYLLDPKLWQAIGKVEGWGSFYDEEGMPRIYGTQGWYPNSDAPSGEDNSMWQAHMHRMIDALCEGKTIEEFLGAL